MSNRDNSQPAFPRPCSEDRKQGDQPEGNKTVGEQDGMSLRDYFAAKAMQGLVGGTFQSTEVAAESGYKIAPAAYRIADAMLVAKAQEGLNIGAMRKALVEILDEMDNRYDGAPDSKTIWMGPHINQIRDALPRTK